jgi:hypothetical protein
MVTMHTLEGFTPVGEAATDDRARIALGKYGASKDARYAAYTNRDGEILLVPLASIPKREAWLYQNHEALQMVLTGLAQSAAGDTVSLGDFSQYADDDIDELDDDDVIDAEVANIDAATASPRDVE